MSDNSKKFPDQMNLADYYEMLGKQKVAFRDRIIEKFKYKSIKTFYNKLNGDGFKEFELDIIREIAEEFNQPI